MVSDCPLVSSNSSYGLLMDHKNNDFISNNTVNQVDRNVCCMDIEVVGLRAPDKLRICVFYAMKTGKNACIIRSECTHYADILLCMQTFQIRSVLVQSCT